MLLQCMVVGRSLQNGTLNNTKHFVNNLYYQNIKVMFNMSAVMKVMISVYHFYVHTPAAHLHKTYIS